MTTEDRLRETAARCLSILRRYRDGERTAAAKALMVAEVEMIVGWLRELNLPDDATDSLVLAPVEDYLVALYGYEAGRRLNAEFVEAFEGAGMGRPPVDRGARYADYVCY